MKDYKDLEKKLGIKIKDKDLLSTAFVHRSYINEHRGQGVENNERLEFLGDAVLELAATRHLFEKYPSTQEGEMTTFRSALVKGDHLAEIARKLELGKYLLLSKGETKANGNDKNYILANTMEALIGAIYLDKDFETAEKIIKKFVLDELDEIVAQGLHVDAKSRFQENCQELIGITPHYEILEEEGPDHDKCFTMGAYIGEKLIAKGKGPSKQKAEDKAAKNALKIKKWH